MSPRVRFHHLLSAAAIAAVVSACSEPAIVAGPSLRPTSTDPRLALLDPGAPGLIAICSSGGPSSYSVTASPATGTLAGGGSFSLADGACVNAWTAGAGDLTITTITVTQTAGDFVSIEATAVPPEGLPFMTVDPGTKTVTWMTNADHGGSATFFQSPPPPPPQACPVVAAVPALNDLTNLLFLFADGSTDANWQGATKGFSGNVVVDGISAKERTSGGVPYAGTITTNDVTLGAWQNIVNQNAGQAFAVTGAVAQVAALESDLANAFSQINGMAANAPAGFTGTPQSLNGLNTQNGSAEVFVLDMTSGFQVSTKIDITGDASDVFIMRWDSDAALAGYQGQVKFQSGGAIVPLGGLTPASFVHVAGDITASGGGSNPAVPFPQGPGIPNGANWNGGGFFTGYWLTTGNAKRETASMSNAIFVGGWYTTTVKFSMTSGTSGVHVPCPK